MFPIIKTRALPVLFSFTEICIRLTSTFGSRVEALTDNVDAEFWGHELMVWEGDAKINIAECECEILVERATVSY